MGRSVLFVTLDTRGTWATLGLKHDLLWSSDNRCRQPEDPEEALEEITLGDFIRAEFHATRMSFHHLLKTESTQYVQTMTIRLSSHNSDSSLVVKH